MNNSTKIRMGMIGGGKNAFIGAVHRMAAGMDGHIELCCGALSADPHIARESGELLSLPQDRIYTSYQEMIAQESQIPADKRIHFVSIVTPNFAHFEPAMMALDHGFHVVLEKTDDAYTGASAAASVKSGRNRTPVMSYAYLFRLSYGQTGKTTC
ncbi:Oxidoreductase family, NAD-binding Rossmann fold [Sphingobacterium spiritivorum]|uniref:Oxidoreductase family, NAD-binding Rossmann fold n=1 Tax=Sphingobacterium spiritivorum TaxID=258 RepID=A0A380CPH8_SPHSI|nr:Oxidoreductase family, NAD-binding Rossmann fold [Sphingobacterium spiritivorum]